MTDNLFEEIALSALSTKATLRATYDLTMAALERIPGDLVECGVFAGANAAMMATALFDWRNNEYMSRGPLEANAYRRLHLFDSFTGIPAAGPEDVEFLEAKHPTGLSACSLEQVRANFRKWGIDDSEFVYHEGLFELTMPISVPPNPSLGPNAPTLAQIAVLRMDGDLYASTKPIMEHLYPLVSPGGWVICDDYHLSGCRKAIEEAIGVPSPMYWSKP